MLNRRVTRVFKNSTDATAAMGTLNSDTLAAALTTSDYLYVGYHGKFASRYFVVGTANTNTASLVAEYWNGSAWVAVDDLQDGTATGGKTLAQSGFVSWENDGLWQESEVEGRELYWIRFSVSANLSAGTTLQAIVNLFSDDLLLRQYYPELVTDTRYLPSSRTNFLEQHEAAKNLCVLRLKQRKVIDDESQIIDINSVAVAAVHATAWLILNPIATADATKELAGRAFDQFSAEIGALSLDTDQDKDGVISEGEREASMNTVGVYRR